MDKKTPIPVPDPQRLRDERHQAELGSDHETPYEHAKDEGRSEVIVPNPETPTAHLPIPD